MSNTVTPEFYNFWKNHRHAGFAEKAGQRRWNITPLEAWNCERYRVELSSDTGDPFQPANQYSASEIERWATDQQAAVDSGWIPSPEEFIEQIRIAAQLLAKKFAERNKQAIGDRQELSESQIQSQINQLQPNSPTKDWHQKMRE